MSAPNRDSLSATIVTTVRDAVHDAIETLADDLRRPALVTRAQLCRELAISSSTASRLVREGMPSIKLAPGQGAVRYDLTEVLDWLRERDLSEVAS